MGFGRSAYSRRTKESGRGSDELRRRRMQDVLSRMGRVAVGVCGARKWFVAGVEADLGEGLGTAP
jgi:hypothetical protein